MVGVVGDAEGLLPVFHLNYLLDIILSKGELDTILFRIAQVLASALQIVVDVSDKFVNIKVSMRVIRFLRGRGPFLGVCPRG